MVSQRLGDQETAANILGKIMKSFPSSQEEAKIAISASAILAQLGNYEQAVMYLHHALVKGAPKPLTNLHLMFYMSRLHERWAYSKNTKFIRAPASAIDQSRAGFARCYEHEEEVSSFLIYIHRRRRYPSKSNSAPFPRRSQNHSSVE
jgi:hypothetical protein